ncbi:hypothetical protein [Sphingobium yanoikuyae]|nr:hypothetical protein [Sphingobium yanoikuyae]
MASRTARKADKTMSTQAPAFRPPQLAKLVDVVPSGKRWLHDEI